jgi:predicted alpha/beta superfamily hydrolase
MKSMVFALIAAILCIMTKPTQSEAAGRLIKLGMISSTYVAPREVIVWVPDGYDASSTRYAVLYMHDGRNLFDPKTAYGGQIWGADAAVAKLMDAGQIRPTIIVGVDNTPARSREYMPGKVFAALDDKNRQALSSDMKGDPVSDAYLKFLTKELKPLIDAHFRTLPGREATFIMGSSMGGLISMYALAEYPEVFGGAGCLSTHWPLPAFAMGGPKIAAEPALAAFDHYLETGALKHPTGRIWFDHGDQTLDSFYAPYQTHIDATLTRLGWKKGVDFESRAYPGAAHNEVSWRARLEDPLRFLLAPPAH